MIYGGVGIDTVAPNKIFIGNNVAITAGTRILTHYLDPSRSGRMFRIGEVHIEDDVFIGCLLYTSPSPRDRTRSRMPSSA